MYANYSTFATSTGSELGLPVTGLPLYTHTLLGPAQGFAAARL